MGRTLRDWAVDEHATLLGDIDTWYETIGQEIGRPWPVERPTNFRDQVRRSVARSDLDDLITGRGSLNHSYPTSTDVETVDLGGGLWLTNMGQSTDESVTRFREKAARTWPLDLAPMLTPASGLDLLAENFRQAEQQLAQAIPEIWSTTRAFVGIVVVCDSPIESMYITDCPESMFVSEDLAKNGGWQLADAVLHESLHGRTSAFRQLRNCFRKEYSEQLSATTLLPWSAGYERPRHFTTWRLLSAGHVYVHLTKFRIEARLPADQIEAVANRASFMIDALMAEDHRKMLGPDGLNLLEALSVSIREM